MGTRLRSLLFVLCAVSAVAIQLCRAERSITVVGNTECLDCAEKNIKTENAVKGLRVAINCKVSNEQYETQATAELGSSGDFAVKLPAELLTDAGELRHECFAQLHAKSNKPCPGKNGLVPSKLVLRSKDAVSGEHTFAAASGGKLSFSSATCASAFFFPCPPHAWKKKLPKFHFPYFKHHDHDHDHPHPYPHPFKFHKTPEPEPEHKQPSGGGYYNPPAHPTYKPSPLPFHEHHEHPIYKKPLPPLHEHHEYPIYKKPLPPLHEHHEHPIYKKPLPPLHEHIHPIFKKPLPPLHEHHHPIFKKPMPPFHHDVHPGHPPVDGHQR